ncbi:Weak acid resistance protein 1 [Talaromyces islandicus]|uniref:Weak acid resistance protein 1 n=1 Tax=Talaromyces islandicus TaxID=28573 RepID=A0A0U1LYD6_TALIS|nr:Weak acid resistance protein 1 [Talaromyces islandicus]
MVVFPPGTTMENVRSDKPILFWAIVAASINTIKPDVQPLLIQETYRAFGEHIFVRRQKSLELVQALIICCLWYNSPERIEELNVYQLVHSAVVMAMDLGMNKQVPKKKMTFRSIQEATRRIPISFNADGIETRRTWISVYFLSVLVSISFKREILLRWNYYTDECLEIMEGNSETVPSDVCLLHWLKIAHIMEQVGTHFALDQRSNAFRLEDPRVQYALKTYEKLLQQWEDGIFNVTAQPIPQKLMRQASQMVKIHMHEVGMHFELDDIMLRPASGLSAAGIQSAERINSLISCVTSTHANLEIFFSVDIKDSFRIPTIFIARTSYCAMILMRLSVIASKAETHVSSIYAPVDLKAEYYIDKMVERTRNMATMKGGKPFARIGRVLKALQDWFIRPEGPKMPFEEAITNLSYPRHVTSVMRELFKRAAQDPAEQDSQSAKTFRTGSSICNFAKSLRPTRSHGQTQGPDGSLPTYDLSTGHDDSLFSSMLLAPSNMDNTLDSNELCYLGSLLDNGILETSSSFDDLMGFF